MYRILLVDDHKLVREGVKAIIDSSEDMIVVSEASSGEEAVDFVSRGFVGVVLMDLSMPGIGGITATRQIVKKHPHVKVVALTALSETPYPAIVMGAGAIGYVHKGCESDELFQAIRTAASNEQYISNEIARQMLLQGMKGDVKPATVLSDREFEVMLMITRGETNQAIADAFVISPKTVSTYRKRIYDKLDVSNDVELTHLALRHSLLD